MRRYGSLININPSGSNVKKEVSKEPRKVGGENRTWTNDPTLQIDVEMVCKEISLDRGSTYSVDKLSMNLKQTRQESSMNDPLGQPTVPAGSDCRSMLKFWEGRTD